MMHDNAVRQVDNETIVVCPRTRTRVRRITNLFCSLFNRLCYENNGRNISWKLHRVWKKGATLFFAVTVPNPNRSSKFFYHHTQQ